MSIDWFSVALLGLLLPILAPCQTPKKSAPAKKEAPKKVVKPQLDEEVVDWSVKPVSKAKRRAEYVKNIKGLEFSHHTYIDGLKADCFTVPGDAVKTGYIDGAKVDAVKADKVHCYLNPEQDHH